jgi:toxin ParE1/3/4
VGNNATTSCPGLRTVGFERRVTVAFSVEIEVVLIQRIFYGGQDWAAELGPINPSE